MLNLWGSRRRANTPSRSGKPDFPLRSLILPIVLRDELKLPLGELLRGEPEANIEKLRRRLEERPPLFAAVGDFVAQNAINGGLDPDIIVIDGKTLRSVVQSVRHNLKEEHVVNPPATIQAAAWQVLRAAITLKSKAAVIVEGEEDLLVLPLMADAPLGSVIIYGQPHEGIVAVRVTDERRRWARNFLNRMEEIE